MSRFRASGVVPRDRACPHSRRSTNGERLRRLIDLEGRYGTDHQLNRTTGVSVVDRDRGWIPKITKRVEDLHRIGLLSFVGLSRNWITLGELNEGLRLARMFPPRTAQHLRRICAGVTEEPDRMGWFVTGQNSIFGGPGAGLQRSRTGIMVVSIWTVRHLRMGWAEATKEPVWIE